MTKKLKNELRDFPSPYDGKYWSEDGETFNIPLFNRDLFTAVHNLCIKLEMAKQEFPKFEKDEELNRYTFKTDFSIEAAKWFEKYIGTGGTGNGILGLSR